MIKNLITILFLVWVAGCAHTLSVPAEFVYAEIKTSAFTLASWQKITDKNAPYKIYIEGDGHAFNSHGRPTNNPIPKGTLVRELAFGDNSPNVVYLARPCQYVKSDICAQRHWTTARFAPEVINSEYEAVKQIAGGNDVILIGFSGGAQVAGLMATLKPDIKVKKVIAIAGNLNHLAWTEYHRLPPLNESLNLANYRAQFANIPQIHYTGTNDKIMPPELIYNFAADENKIVIVKGATHNSGWQSIYSAIWTAK